MRTMETVMVVPVGSAGDGADAAVGAGVAVGVAADAPDGGPDAMVPAWAGALGCAATGVGDDVVVAGAPDAVGCGVAAGVVTGVLGAADGGAVAVAGAVGAEGWAVVTVACGGCATPGCAEAVVWG